MNRYFVIGNPIRHSLSPKLQNYWIKDNNLDATYFKVELQDNEIENFMQDIKNQKISGCNVTVPFKKKVIPFLDKLSPDAEKTQSVNTIMLENGDLVGHNTDILGFIKAVKSLNFNFKNKKIFILGAGGVVPSLIFALNKIDVSDITVSNRTRNNAENLRNQFKNLKVIDWGDITDFDVMINATSIGLNNETINLNFPKEKNKLFYDVIYNPLETDFLKQGKRLGNMVENGKLMFIYQAAEAFKLWHGIEPKINNQIIKLLDDD